MLFSPLFDTTERPSTERTILVVDDDPIIRLLLETTIRGEPYRVITAADGEEALATAMAIHPSVILLDVSMPKIDGFEVCRQIKSDPKMKDISIIMVTAKAQANDRARGLAVGVDAYVTKPFSPLQLLEILERQLNAH